MTNWKPPSITTRTAEYLRKIGHLSDADKLEYFDNIVGAAFRKGYNVRKGDELKMRGEKVHNAPHEGPGAASSRTVPLDAVVGPRGSERNER